jgi:hypothetical protein
MILMATPRYTLEKISGVRIKIYGISGDDVFPEFIKIKEFEKFLEEEKISVYNKVRAHRVLYAEFKPSDAKKVLKWLKKKGCESPQKTKRSKAV